MTQRGRVPMHMQTPRHRPLTMNLLALSLLVATLSLGKGRTTVLQGVVHLVLFAVYLFTSIVP